MGQYLHMARHPVERHTQWKYDRMCNLHFSIYKCDCTVAAACYHMYSIYRMFCVVNCLVK